MEVKNLGHLKNIMKNQTKVLQISNNSGYDYYFCRQFLDRLFKTDPDHFILIGSFSQFAYMGDIKRPLTDIDVHSDKLDEGIDVVKVAIDDSKNDKIVLNLKDIFITPNNTACIRIMCNFEKMQHLIGIDITEDRYLSVDRRGLPALLDIDAPFDVNTITLEEHFARKLKSACLRLQWYKEESKPFRRFKDFYDLNVMLESGKVDLDKALEYFNEMRDIFQFKVDPSIIDDEFIIKNKEKWDVEASSYSYKENDYLATLACVKNVIDMAAMRKGRQK
ncbi:MAG: nucleotidyl transferase AbiEii/AbiGii toxin family protein [Bacilli bacterium]